MKRMIGIALCACLIAAVLYGADNYVRKVGTVRWTNPSAAVSSGDVIDLGSRYGIVHKDVASNAVGIVFTEGIFTFTLATNETISIGDQIYWDSSNTQVTETATTDTYLGAAVQAKTTTSATTILRVEINAFVQPGGLAAIDGENIVDDTIDDDSIDFSTGAGVSGADMPDEDLGDISVSNGSWTIDAGAVKSNDLATADFGMVNVSTGTVSINAGVITSNMLNASDYASGTFTNLAGETIIFYRGIAIGGTGVK
jgi:predicted RecA/RadA family phage recombinase